MCRLQSFLVTTLIVSLIAAPAFAQGPTINVYFDAGLTQKAIDCPGPSLDTLYVVAENFNTFLSAVEFKVNLPPQIIWLADFGMPPVTLGTTVTGVSIGYALPQNGFTPLVVARMIILWNCVDCSSGEGFIEVVPNPVGGLRGVEFGTNQVVDADGGMAVVCQEPAKMDIRPTSCPNPFNKKLFDFVDDARPMKGGVLPVAILGTSTFDVALIDPSSIRLEGVEPAAQGGGPTLGDVETPVDDNSDCQCSTAGPDGIVDLHMKFNAQDIAEAIGPGDGDRMLTMTFDYAGIPYEATDCIRVVGKELNPPQPSENITISIFPNPFNPTARVKFELPESQHVRLAVYTVAGRHVADVYEGVKAAGEHVMEWDASGMPSGVYFIRLEGRTETVVRRVTLLK